MMAVPSSMVLHMMQREIDGAGWGGRGIVSV